MNLRNIAFTCLTVIDFSSKCPSSAPIESGAAISCPHDYFYRLTFKNKKQLS